MGKFPCPVLLVCTSSVVIRRPLNDDDHRRTRKQPSGFINTSRHCSSPGDTEGTLRAAVCTFWGRGHVVITALASAAFMHRDHRHFTLLLIQHGRVGHQVPTACLVASLRPQVAWRSRPSERIPFVDESVRILEGKECWPSEQMNTLQLQDQAAHAVADCRGHHYVALAGRMVLPCPATDPGSRQLRCVTLCHVFGDRWEDESRHTCLLTPPRPRQPERK
jgi:hypothetical protein